MILGFTITPDQRPPKKLLLSVDSVCHVSSGRARVYDHAHRAHTGQAEAASSAAKAGRPLANYGAFNYGKYCGLVVTRVVSLYNPALDPPCTDRTPQPCEHTDDSSLTNTLAHPRLAVPHQRRHLYRPRQYLRDRASNDAGLWDDRSTDGLGLLGLRRWLCPVSDSWWMAGRSLGSPRGTHRRASLVVDLYGLHRHGGCYLAREPLRDCRLADARAVFVGCGRSRGAACLQSRRHQLATG